MKNEIMQTRTNKIILNVIRYYILIAPIALLILLKFFMAEIDLSISTIENLNFILKAFFVFGVFCFWITQPSK